MNKHLLHNCVWVDGNKTKTVTQTGEPVCRLVFGCLSLCTKAMKNRSYMSQGLKPRPRSPRSSLANMLRLALSQITKTGRLLTHWHPSFLRPHGSRGGLFLCLSNRGVFIAPSEEPKHPWCLHKQPGGKLSFEINARAKDRTGLRDCQWHAPTDIFGLRISGLPTWPPWANNFLAWVAI